MSILPPPALPITPRVVNFKKSAGGMVDIPQWFVWRIYWDEETQKNEKRPTNLTTFAISAKSPENWMTCDEAFALRNTMRLREKGATRYVVGFMLTDDCGYWLYDIDSCVVDGQLSPFAAEQRDQLKDCFFEISSSGNGVHIVGKNTHATHPDRKKVTLDYKGQPQQIEFYTKGRGIAFGLDDIAEGSADVAAPGDWMHNTANNWLAEPVKADPPAHVTQSTPLANDAELIKIASGASNGQLFQDLYYANDAALCGRYPANGGGYDRSEADWALAGQLRFYTGNDAAQMERIMCGSALNRPKWDREGYLTATIANVIKAGGPTYKRGAGFDPDAEFAPIPQIPVSNPTETEAIPVANGWDLAMTAKPAQYLIDGFLETDANGILGGASMTYKSFFAMRMAHSICSGEPFMGRRVYKTGPVVLVCGEGQGAVTRRLKALVLKLGKPKHMIHVVPMGVSLTCRESMGKLTEKLKQINPVLVIFDTFASLSGGIEENSNSEVGTALNLVRDTCRIAGASSMIVHHFGKDAEKGFRGASAFINNVDFAFTVARNGVEHDRKALVTCVKMKDGEHFHDILFQSVVVPLGMKEQNGKESTSLVAEHDVFGAPHRVLSQEDTALRELKALQAAASTTCTTDDPMLIKGSDWDAASEAAGVSNPRRERKKLLDSKKVAKIGNSFRAL